MTIVCSFSRPRFRAALCSVSALALASATPALAQEAVGELDELIVTAEKREQSVKDVPSSVTVVGGQRLERSSASQISDYAGYVPGLTLTSGSSPGQNHLVIRGLTTGSTASATVGVYVDDTPYGTARGQGRFALDLMPYDVERVEILRGPQGTLYGASTLGGLLKYVTRAPDTQDYELRVGGELTAVEHGGEGHAFRIAANAPLMKDKLAIRGSYYTQENAGYVDAVGRKANANRDTQEGGRLAVLFRPMDALTIRLTGSFQNLTSKDNAIVNVGPSTSKSAQSRPALFGNYAHQNLIPGTFDQEVEIYSANVSWDLGLASLTFDSSLSKSATETGTDNTVLYRPILQPIFGFPVSTVIGVAQESEKRTQELRLASPSGGKFEWLVGAYYTSEKNENDQLLTALGPTGAALGPPFGGIGRLATVAAPSSYKETAVFGDVTVRFNEQFDVTGGLRFSRNEQKSVQNSRGLLFGPAPTLGRGSSEEDVVTFALSPRFKLNDDVMIYARLASGYRPGGPNVIFPGQSVPATYKSDTVLNYEAGVKGYWLDRTLSVDASLYYIDWTDIQIVQVFGGVQGLGNGDDASSKGFEIQSAYAPVEGLTFGMGLAYTDAQLTSDAPAISGKDGDRVPFVPRWSGSLTVDYTRAAFGDFQWRIGAGYRYKGQATGSFKSAGDYIEYDGYGLVDGYVGLENGRWSARLFGRNLLDERVFVSAALPGQLVINQPRVVGLSLNASF